jgi:hypothetical protein
MDSHSVKKCVLMKHGMTIYGNSKIGTCCYNGNNPSNYSSYDIDPVGCKQCIDQELSGIKSYRQGANEKYGLDHSHQSPLVVDFTVNRNCNLACKICNEHASSTWAKLKTIKINSSHSISTSQFVKLLDNVDLSHVQEINFSGGEPLLNDNIKRYVSLLSQQIDFSTCILRFSTNGTMVLSSNLIEFFQQFLLVLARFSLDDIEDGHNYQRWPSEWHHWEKNWQDFLNRAPHNTIPSINRTIGILNINRLPLLEKWLKTYPLTRFNDPIELHDHLAIGDYALTSVTQRLKDHIYQKYGADSRSWQLIKHFVPTDNLQQLQTTIQQHDKLQGTNLGKMDPELYRILFE